MIRHPHLTTPWGILGMSALQCGKTVVLTTSSSLKRKTSIKYRSVPLYLQVHLEIQF